jgi:hypothetical protein
MRGTFWSQIILLFQCQKEILPFGPNLSREVIPDALDPNIVNTSEQDVSSNLDTVKATLPSPNVGTMSYVQIHPPGNLDVLQTVISSHSPWNTVPSCLKK